MQNDVTKFIQSIPVPAAIILTGFCVVFLIFGVLGARKAWRDGSRFPALFYGLMALAFGAMAIAMIVGMVRR